MNITEQIKKWAKSCNIEESEDSKNLYSSITGRYRPTYFSDEDGEGLQYLMANFNPKTFKWNVISIVEDANERIIGADDYTEREFDTIDDAVAYIRDLEHDDALEKDIR